MGIRTWSGRSDVAVTASCRHVNIVRLHAKSARGGQLSEMGTPLGHHETAVKATEKVKGAYKRKTNQHRT